VQEVGSQVTGGTVNHEGPLDVRATATGSDSTLAGALSFWVVAYARAASFT
jgi:cation transport ATPase